MAPPQFSDLGKSSKDMFNKGYNYGSVKLDLKSKTKNNIDFNITGEHNTDVQKSFGTLEAKYKAAAYGLNFTEKWNTDNILKSELSFEDNLVKGLKLGVDTTFSPATGKKTGIIKGTYKHDKVFANFDIDLDPSGPVVHDSFVIGHLGWLFGLQFSYDTAKSQFTRNNFAVGYQAPDFTLHTNVNDGTEVGGSLYQKVNDQLELGVSLSWSSVSNATRFALASKYSLDKHATVQAKVNNMSQIGFSYTQRLRDGVKVIVSSLLDGKNINGGGHKLGLGFELEA